jgi:hypothetical protein
MVAGRGGLQIEDDSAGAQNWAQPWSVVLGQRRREVVHPGAPGRPDMAKVEATRGADTPVLRVQSQQIPQAPTLFWPSTLRP